jgi:hypothetical protein
MLEFVLLCELFLAPSPITKDDFFLSRPLNNFISFKDSENMTCFSDKHNGIKYHRYYVVTLQVRKETIQEDPNLR